MSNYPTQDSENISFKFGVKFYSKCYKLLSLINCATFQAVFSSSSSTSFLTIFIRIQKMNSFLNKFSSIRHFPELHETIASIDGQKKAELGIIEANEKAFSDDFKKYANQQKPDFSNALISICECGVHEVAIIKDSFVGVTSLSTDLQPLFQQEAEIDKYRQLVKAAQEQAKKSQQVAAKQEANYNRAKVGGKQSDISKAEVSFSAAKRKADDDTNSYEYQKRALDEKELPYRKTFLESYTKAINAALNLRIQESEKLLKLTDEFDDAISKLCDFEDDGIAHYQRRLEELEAMTVE